MVDDAHGVRLGEAGPQVVDEAVGRRVEGRLQREAHRADATVPRGPAGAGSTPPSRCPVRPSAGGQPHLGAGEPRHPSVGGRQDERPEGDGIDGQVDPPRLDAGTPGGGEPVGVGDLGHVEPGDRHGVAGAVLHVAQRERVTRDADVGAVDPGPVVEPPGEPAPSEGPPVADAPGVVALAVALDRQHLVAHGDRPAHQAGDLVAGGDVVLVGHAVRRPREVQPEGGRRARVVPVDVGRPVVDAGRRRPVDPDAVERRLDVGVHGESGAVQTQAELGDREVVGDRRHHRAVGADDHGRPPGHPEVRVEPDAGVAGHPAVVGDDVEVVGLVPQRIVGRQVALLVVRLDGVGIVIGHGCSWFGGTAGADGWHVFRRGAAPGSPWV